MTRRISCHEVLGPAGETLDQLFYKRCSEKGHSNRTVCVSDSLNISPGYLSGLLKSLTGESTQQYVHNKLIEVGKEKLSTTSLSVGEIAYHLITERK